MLVSTSPPSATGRKAADDLLLAAAAGDADAFAGFYDATVGSVHGVVLRVLRDPAQTEEVVQEVYLEVWRTAGRFDPLRGAASSFVVTMAHRRAVDRVRSARADRERDDRVALQEVSPFDSVTEEVVARAERDEVREALDTLTPLQRQAVELAYFGGRTHREISAELDVPLGTVKARLRDGLLRLKTVMGVRS
ncbi:ECF RNA polymerase sigma factor SigK [Kineococcus gynurae]|uniref:ECF RNA polymerase sigma factor SigK n=1 Tax=Kineococcus gynurae TaxID=452979 RepID=A0ABV5LXC2_9ACTN